MSMILQRNMGEIKLVKTILTVRDSSHLTKLKKIIEIDYQDENN